MRRTFAVSDLHGMYDLYKQINEFITPEDVVFCLGDCGDRGPDGWRIITEVLSNPQWFYLKGNHEDMLAKAIKSVSYDVYDSDDYFLLCHNGGGKTYQDWGTNTNWDTSWANELNKLPYFYAYNNLEDKRVYLSHAGFNPMAKKLNKLTEETLIWDRNHLKNSHWLGAEDEIIIHGHTPVALANKGRSRPDLLRIENYCDGHKYNLDLASWYTGVACLLDLNTFEEHYFYTEPLKI